MYSFVLNLNTNVTPWHTGNAAASHLVCREDGGTEFYELLGGNYTAGPEYIMKPDFTWENTSHLVKDSTSPAIGSDFFTSKNIYPHVCGGDTLIDTATSLEKIKKEVSKPIALSAENSHLLMNVSSDDIYSIELFSINGRHISTIKDYKMVAGINKLEIDSLKHSKGIYFVKIKSKKEFIRQKVIIK